MKRRTIIPAMASLLMAGRGTLAQASAGTSLNIAPVNLALGGVGDETVCTVNNYGDSPASGQIRIKCWRQTAGQDALEDTADVVASPPFMTVDPGGQQIVRLVNLAAGPGSAETAFRLLFNQVPTGMALTGPGIHLLMAFSLPLFIPGTDGVPPQLQAGFAAAPAGIVLRVTNQGDIHARLVDVTVRDAGGATVFTAPGLAGYVLARSTRDFPTRLRNSPQPGGAMTVTTQVSKTPLVVPLTTNL